MGGDESQAQLKDLDGKFGYTLVMWANTSAGKGRESSPKFVDGELMMLWGNKGDPLSKVQAQLFYCVPSVSHIPANHVQ